MGVSTVLPLVSICHNACNSAILCATISIACRLLQSASAGYAAARALPLEPLPVGRLVAHKHLTTQHGTVQYMMAQKEELYIPPPGAIPGHKPPMVVSAGQVRCRQRSSPLECLAICCHLQHPAVDAAGCATDQQQGSRRLHEQYSHQLPVTLCATICADRLLHILLLGTMSLPIFHPSQTAEVCLPASQQQAAAVAAGSSTCASASARQHQQN